MPRDKQNRFNLIGFACGLAIEILEAALPWSKVPIPRELGILMLFIGLALLLWCGWAIGRHRSRVFGILGLVIVILFTGSVAWLSHRDLVKSKYEVKIEPAQADPGTAKNVPQPTVTHHSVAVEKKSPTVYEFTLVLHNDTSAPQFYSNGQVIQPLSYRSGMAEFRLPAGSYNLRADYESWTCTAFVSLPLENPEPIAGDCKLK